jgi:hypothetical protein
LLAVTRFRVAPGDGPEFLRKARVALASLAERPGWRAGNIGRAMDDPTLWVLASEWSDVGSYRRALSSYDVKVSAVALLAQALDEPTAFELLTSAEGDGSALAADASVVGVGEAAAPVVATDLD